MSGKSLLQRLAKSYPSLFSAQDDNTDDEAAMGYESSWSGNIYIYKGVIDENGPQSDIRVLLKASWVLEFERTRNF